jgi:hypothetical protein
MNRTLTFTSAVVIGALALPAIPAVAQARGQQRGGGRAAASQPAPRSAPQGRTFSAPQGRTFSAPQGRTFAAPQGRTFAAPQGRTFSAPQGRTFAAPQGRTFAAPQGRTYAGPQGRTYVAPQGRTYATPQGRTYVAPQGRTYAAPRTLNNGSYQRGPTAVPRTYNGGSGYRAGDRNGGSGYRAGDRNRYGDNHYGGMGYRGYGRPGTARPYFSHNYVRPYSWVPYHPYRFGRPYYVFSPWLSIGFGLWAGYPVSYPWNYLGDYDPTVFGYYSDSGYDVTAGVSIYGGVSFDIQPANADVFVDGQYAGPVSDFGPNSEPLTLDPGTHQIAIQCAGYRPLEWDVTIEPGQVIPYRGVLELQ